MLILSSSIDSVISSIFFFYCFQIFDAPMSGLLLTPIFSGSEVPIFQLSWEIGSK